MFASLPYIIGNNIKILRKMKNISVQQIAECLGISVQQVYKYESGKSILSAVDLVKIATLFGVSARTLIEPIDILS